MFIFRKEIHGSEIITIPELMSGMHSPEINAINHVEKTNTPKHNERCHIF